MLAQCRGCVFNTLVGDIYECKAPENPYVYEGGTCAMRQAEVVEVVPSLRPPFELAKFDNVLEASAAIGAENDLREFRASQAVVQCAADLAVTNGIQLHEAMEKLVSALPKAEDEKALISVVSCPRPDDERHGHEDNLDFFECPTCVVKVGAYTLCNPCLLNRAAIGNLKREAANAQITVDHQEHEIADFQTRCEAMAEMLIDGAAALRDNEAEVFRQAKQIADMKRNPIARLIDWVTAGKEW